MLQGALFDVTSSAISKKENDDYYYTLNKSKRKKSLIGFNTCHFHRY